MKLYPFIEAEKQGSENGAGGNVARACELLKVSRFAYYAHAATQAAGGTTRAREDAVLLERIEAIHEASDGTYGAPRVHQDLAGEGDRHGRKRIARLMRARGLRGKAPRRWRTTTIPDPAAPARPDLIGRDFTPNPFALDQRWCGDITYIRTWEGWLYLATVIDIASRRIVGWASADHLRTDLVEDALRQAVTTRRPAAGVIFHSDRGGSTPVLSSPTGQGIWVSRSRSDGPVNAGTTPSRNRSTPPSRASSSTVGPGAHTPPSGPRSSTTSKAGTTSSAGTPRSATSAQPPTRTPPPAGRPHRHNQPVRQSGSLPMTLPPPREEGAR